MSTRSRRTTSVSQAKSGRRNPESGALGARKSAHATTVAVRTVAGDFSSFPPKKLRAQSTTLAPSRLGGKQVGCDIPLQDALKVESARHLARAIARNGMGMVYDRDWGDCIVDQDLPSDPGPINSAAFKPVSRWIVLYRSGEAGVDGTVTITTSAVREAIATAGTTSNLSFIIKELHVWIAPNVINTHFSGVIYTQEDEANGILPGQYSDVAPLDKFVKFRVRFRGEGLVKSNTDSASAAIIGLGGSAKWNGLIYAKVETYD